MPYKSVEWFPGDTLDIKKIKQMSINDDIIRQAIYDRPQGILLHKYYMGAAITATVGTWTTVTSGTLTLTEPRLLKIYLKALINTSVDGVNPAIRVTRDGTAVAYSRTRTGTFLGSPSSTTTHGYRILPCDAGTFTFALQIGNDTGTAGTTSVVVNYNHNEAATMLIEDVGPRMKG